jgi:hypothetical protein
MRRHLLAVALAVFAALPRPALAQEPAPTPPSEPAPAPTPAEASPPATGPSVLDGPKLVDQGKDAASAAGSIVAPKDGTEYIGGVKQGQVVLEKAGLKRGPPNPGFVAGAGVVLPLCFLSNYGNLNGPQAVYFGPLCRYALVPGAALLLVLAPFISEKKEELVGPSVHHLDFTVYALDYAKRSALTGTLNREPQGGILGNNLGYDLGYTYIHPTVGFVAYGHATLQQTTIADTKYLAVSNNFFKADAQVGIDLIRLLSGGRPDSWWTQHSAFFRGGLSFFHDWIVSRDQGSKAGERYALENPLNNSIALMSGGGFEVAGEVDFRFPYALGGFHFTFERGMYPSIAFPSLNPRDAAFVALVGFDDLRRGDTYTWQRLRADLEIPIDFSRRGGLSLGGQLIHYENNFGSGVDNRGLSLDYKFRFQ